MSLVSSFPHCNVWVMSSHSRSKDHLNRRPSSLRFQAKTRTQFNCHGSTSSLSVEHFIWDSLDDSQGFVGKENEDDLSEHSQMLFILMALWKLITKLQEGGEKTDTSTYSSSITRKSYSQPVLTLQVEKILLSFQRQSVRRRPETMETLSRLEGLNIILTTIQRTLESGEARRGQLGNTRETINDGQQAVKFLQGLFQKLHEIKQDILNGFAGLQKACTEVDKKLPLATEFLTTEHKLKLNNETGTCADTVRVCSCLGLRFDFLDHLGNFSRRIRNHRSIRDWIVKFLWENYESLRFDEKGSLTKELLLAIGFESTSSIETVLTRSLVGNMQQHLEAWEWAAIFVEDEFKYNLLLSSQVEKFPFQCNSTDASFQKSQNNSLNEDEGPVKIRNVSVEKSAMHEKTGSILSELCKEQDQYTVYFHGTDQDSAKDILQRGVDLTTGRQRRDFSSGLGFYVTKDFRIALNWAKSITSKPALLIFQVQRSFPDRFRKRSFLENCADDMMEWEKVVASFRSGNITSEIQKLVKDLDFMEGPEAILTGRNEIDELTFERKPRSHQMCFFSETIAEEFGRSLNSMIIYRLF